MRYVQCAYCPQRDELTKTFAFYKLYPNFWGQQLEIDVDKVIGGSVRARQQQLCPAASDVVFGEL